MNRIVTYTHTVLVLLLLSACKHRDLYVYGDEFHSVELNVDWRLYNATHDPDGMTVWFYPLDNPGHRPYRTTTANVRRVELYLPGGHYHGVVIDYSPEEYSRQTFLGMDSVATLRVESLPASYQPDSLTIVGEGVAHDLSAYVNSHLYGDAAWTDLQTLRPTRNAATNLYTVASAPESMGLDTLANRLIYQSEYNDYIPYKEREGYQSTLTVQQLTSQPVSIIWHLRLRIHISEGYNYLWQQVASISGLADGHLLALNQNTEQGCLMSISEWEQQRTGANEGYIAATITTFGLRPGSIRPDAVLHGDLNRSATGSATDDRLATRAAGDTEADVQPDDWWSYRSDICLPGELRLNLSFVLRDHATVLNYHFDVGDHIDSYDNQLVLRIDLEPDIVLPYVDAYSGAGFGADVTPWQEQTPLDVSM